MRIKSIHLENIRSYLDEKIEFPEGSTLLSGDIGSGKSTILMSLEFALFGLAKGEITGTDLLRHGKDTGSVKLHMDVNDKDVIVERTLKRGKTVTQDSGILEIDGKREELTPVEIKSKVLEMFGYPLDLLKKNKPIFRFTVYTPQESMKQIMFLPEVRIETLRSIFDVDKYGVIRNNSRTFVTELRTMKREYEAQIRDLETDVTMLRECEGEKTETLGILSSEKNNLERIANDYKSKKSGYDMLRSDFILIQSARTDFARKEAEETAKKRRLDTIKTDIEETKRKMEEYESMIQPGINLPELKERLRRTEDEKDSFVSQRAVLMEEIRKLRKVYDKGVCEMCGQKVHNVEEFSQHISEKESRIGEIQEKSEQTLKELTALKSEVLRAEKASHTQKLIDDMQSSVKRIESEKASLLSDLSLLETQISDLSRKTERFDDVKEKMDILEREFDEINRKKTEAERTVARHEQHLNDIEKRMHELQKRIGEKEEAKAKIGKINAIVNWFDNFLGLMETMEKHVMASLQMEFDQYFQKWFSVLMADQMSVKINETFSPVIEQNGYETSFDNLSGGEKTSVALAYRLALNKVVNDMIDTINTKDFMILDEPTDGFSTDQLDRIRDVIDELKLKQIIIVSHEQKIDTYVDNVIRIYKEGHVSKVAY